LSRPTDRLIFLPLLGCERGYFLMAALNVGPTTFNSLPVIDYYCIKCIWEITIIIINNQKNVHTLKSSAIYAVLLKYSRLLSIEKGRISDILSNKDKFQNSKVT